MLRVNDVEVPTQLAGTRDAALGFGTMGWLSCAPVGLGYLPTDTVSVQAWEGMTPSNMLLTRAENEPAPESVAASARPSEITGLTRSSPTLFTGELRGDEERILVMTDNANVGWQGTVAGQPLTPVTVDGFRQGFIVPAGASGELTVRFGPDGIYRVSLAAGFALALLLLPMLLRTGRPSAPLMEMTIPPPLSTPRGRLYAEVSAVVLGIIVAGPVGGVVALVVVLALRVRRLGRHSAELVVALVLVAGLVAAFGSAVATAQSLEIATRILVLLALVVVVAQPNATQAPPRANS
ncbi:MAG TPA: hypothetical protein GX718_15570 [Brevibacterium sp.]|nr:hypothetical protein [Brevibacterium sp.]